MGQKWNNIFYHSFYTIIFIILEYKFHTVSLTTLVERKGVFLFAITPIHHWERDI